MPTPDNSDYLIFTDLPAFQYRWLDFNEYWEFPKIWKQSDRKRYLTDPPEEDPIYVVSGSF